MGSYPFLCCLFHLGPQPIDPYHPQPQLDLYALFKDPHTKFLWKQPLNTPRNRLCPFLKYPSAQVKLTDKINIISNSITVQEQVRSGEEYLPNRLGEKKRIVCFVCYHLQKEEMHLYGCIANQLRVLFIPLRK